MVSLPSKWVKKYGLKKGMEINIEEQGNSIIVSTEESTPLFKVNLDITHIDGVLLRRYVTTLYRMGSDELILTYDNPNKISMLQEVLQKNLIGYEIIKQGKNFCVIRNLSSEIETEFNSILRRIFLLLVHMSKEILEAFKQRDTNQLKSIILLEQNNNRFTNFCRRVVNKRGFSDFRKACFVYVIIEQLEKIADEYKYLVDYLVESGIKKKISDETIIVFDRVNKFLETFNELFYGFDNDKAEKFIKERTLLKAECLSLLSTKPGPDTPILHHMITITEMTYNLLAPCIGVTIKID